MISLDELAYSHAKHLCGFFFFLFQVQGLFFSLNDTEDLEQETAINLTPNQTTTIKVLDTN